MTRREFVVATASAAGGLLLAIRYPATAKPRAYEPYPGAAREVSAWLAIEPDNSIIIRCAQAEMGEGAVEFLLFIFPVKNADDIAPGFAGRGAGVFGRAVSFRGGDSGRLE